METGTTDTSYWLNWRFLLCAVYLLCTILLASFLIWKYEGAKKSDKERREHQQVPVGVLCEDELWKTCLKSLHCVWLLLFRVIAFVVLLGIIIGNTVVKGPGIFFYYTQWTFTLTTIYFGFATAFSLYGYCHHHDLGGALHFDGASENGDTERGSHAASGLGSRENTLLLKGLHDNEEVYVHQVAGVMGYVFQIMYQVAAGAVVLTDAVFWLIIYPFLTAKDFKLAFFDVGMHSVNVLILGDTLLNCMRFPMFRFGYFILWTAIFVIFQWIYHMCILLKWPYPFMDLATPYAPLWYLAVGVLHIPCFGILALIVKLKHLWLSRSFPESYQGTR